MFRIEKVPNILPLGNQGETGVRSVSIDCSYWLSQYTTSNIAISFKLPGSARQYPLPTNLYTLQGSVLTIYVSRHLTHLSGRGELLIRLLDTHKFELRSAIIDTEVTPSFEPATDPPDVVMDWIAAAQAKLGEVTALESAVQTAETIRETQESARLDAEDAREQAEGLRVIAEQDRQDAYVLAEEARDGLYEAAEIARDGLYEAAEIARDEQFETAETTRETAEGLRVGAETSRNTAEGLRVIAEEGRQDAYVIAEEGRQDAYVIAEQDRQDAYVLAEEARDGLYEAAEIARDELFESAETTRNTQSGDATEAANAAAGLTTDAIARANNISETMEGIAPRWSEVDISVSALGEGVAPTASITQGETGTSISLGVPKGDTGAQGPIGNVMYATFDIDFDTGELVMTIPDGYTGPTFSINDETGELEVSI